MPDAIVVGASIAGLATAISLLRRGFAVTVVEHAERGAPGGAGLALTHAALLQLHSLGVIKWLGITIGIGASISFAGTLLKWW